MHWKDFLYYQRGEKIAILTLLALIFIVLLLNVALIARESNTIVIDKNDSIIAAFEYSYNSIKVDSVKSFSNKEKAFTRNTNYESNRIEKENNKYTKPDKLKVGETIFLNKSDTIDWKKVPGIGSSFASRIVKYRNMLGGYVSIDQLREVYGMEEDRYSSIVSFIEVDEYVNKLNVNKLEFKDLLKHPYLNYKQVQVIVNLRKKKGDIKSINELSIFDEFTRDDIVQLEPYLEF